MAKRLKSKEKVINKITRDGLVEINKVTDKETLINKNSNNFNLRNTNEVPGIALRKVNIKNNRTLKKYYKRKLYLKSSLENIKPSELSIYAKEVPLSKANEYEMSHNIKAHNIVIDNETLLNKNNDFSLSNAEFPNVDFRNISKKNKKTLKNNYKRQHYLESSEENIKSFKLNHLENSANNMNFFKLSDDVDKIYLSTSNENDIKFNEYKEINNIDDKITTSLFEGKSTEISIPKRQRVYKNRSPTYKNKFIHVERLKYSSISTTKYKNIKLNKSLPLQKKLNSIQKEIKYHQKFITDTSENNEPLLSETKTKLNNVTTKDLSLIDDNKQELEFDKQEPVFEYEERTKNDFKEVSSDTSLTKEIIDSKETIKDRNSPLKFRINENPKKNNIIEKKDKEIQKLEKKVEKYNIKLQKAENRLPSKKKIKLKRVFDENSKKSKIKLQFNKEVILQDNKPVYKPLTVMKSGTSALKYEAIHKCHQKIREMENENVAIKATHETEQFIENYVRGKHITRSTLRFIKSIPYNRVDKLQKRVNKLNRNYVYKKALKENSNLQSNVFSRLAQKRKIKKQYAKNLRKTNLNNIKNTSSINIKVLKATSKLIRKNPIAIGTVAIILLFLFITTSMFNTFLTLSIGNIVSVIATSYTASDTNIDMAELAYTEWETDLLIEGWNAPNTHQGYDEYYYNFLDISHNPYELMAYLTAKYQNFEYYTIETYLREIFEEQYNLTFTEKIETRYDENTEEFYEWRILNVTIITRSFTEIIFSRLNNDEKQLFNLYMQTKGNRQYMSSPLDFNWLLSVTSYYGYRINPITKNKDFHKGVDIALPIGTDIHAGHDGIVTSAFYDTSYGYYVVINGEKGIQSKYAHCNTLAVKVGEVVKAGDVIAKSGNTGNSTGPHLHLEILKNGQYLNPLYFVITNDTSNELVFGKPSVVIGDESYKALIREAEKYLGYPYVFGGSNPNTSFDCSGFICFVYTKSGVYNLPRTTAQGIFNQCTPITSNDVRPGDLVFFSGTYSTPNKVSHVGIYVGNGMMLHAGDPIGYTSINTSYWQSYFYSFGRLN